ncbi:glycosyltransferase family 4 protein [Bosea sp. BH3]|uniref:glycosyltransferase family 4 protein n=1 Tax=Bosea sp. BH3 TaxID=2871701 RepID=UPI0021CB88B1|nr:glycosyltransferase family 4 protein [Bosea sp. BH3]MCU4181150.1 glycosyltransferase family 4 protein [Bosea sp. BH3]
MHILILGGSPTNPGGVEAFCARAEEALLSRNPDARIERISTATAFLSLRRLPGFLGGLARLVEYRRHRPTIVWLQYVNLPDLAYLILARMLGLRVMVTPHLGMNWRSQRNRFLRSLSERILRGASRIALISRTQELEIKLPERVPRSLIRNFLSKELLASELVVPPSVSAPLELVHSGRLSVGKGSLLVLEVCDRLKRDGVRFRARITGTADEETRSAMEEMIRSMDLAGHVELLGRVPEDELLDVLHGSDVLIHLSKIDSYPLIVLEGLACAVYPICLELAGARDMVETYDGFVASPEDPVAQVAAFLKAQTPEDLRSRARAAAVEVRTDYDWSAAADALERAVAAATDNKGALRVQGI